MYNAFIEQISIDYPQILNDIQLNSFSYQGDYSHIGDDLDYEIERARTIGENLRKNLIVIANEVLYVVETQSGKLERPSGGDWIELLVSRG